MSGLEMKYFVLKPKGSDRYAQAARYAMRAYADIISPVNADLAKELVAWADREHWIQRLDEANSGQAPQDV